MKLPKLNQFFPIDTAMAELYGGWLEGPYFKIIFKGSTRIEQINLANTFLQENQFDVVLETDFFDEKTKFYEEGNFEFHYDILGFNQLMLIYIQPPTLKPIDSLIALANSVQREKQEESSNTPQNISMSMAVKTGKLLDQFLWDRNPDSNTVAKEMAGVFNDLLLLSSKLDIDLFEASIELLKRPIKVNL